VLFRSLFGFSTFLGDLDAFAAQSSDRFDVVTMWDVLEHVADPQGMLETAWALLRPGGALFVHTPNIDALERRVFGGWYHSFKPEHLVYFGPQGLVEVAHAAGFTMEFLATDAHLLRGFVGPQVDRFARLLQGSDMFAAAVKRPESG
jgi:2-polyprenyl-3-methyl-5-hydroxy-6-metoxy-1,4-benzoquinol methylase